MGRRWETVAVNPFLALGELDVALHEVVQHFCDRSCRHREDLLGHQTEDLDWIVISTLWGLSWM